MNSGVISTLLHQFPYQFRGIQVLATIGFMVDLTLYIVFSGIFILHFALYRRRALAELTSNVAELCLAPTWAIAFMTLTSFVSLTVTNASWARPHPGWTYLAVAMWWIATIWMFGMLFFCFVTLVREHSLLDRQLPTLIIIPAVGVATLAIVGAVVTNFSHSISAGLAVPIIITSFCAAGVGLILGLILYTYLFHQLLAYGWPAAAQTPTIFILVGPMGQTAAALILLGSASKTHFPEYNRGTFLTAEAAAPMDVACQLLALLMTGLGAIWLILAFCAMIDRAWHRELKWTPAWNAIIFPTGTLVTSTLLFGELMDSSFFRVVTAMMTLFLVIVFFVNAAFTLWKIGRGELLIVREDPRVKKELEEKRNS
ncbi:uncharacterized protein A1O9_09972 [Exophiala aquamarina CBS 119918]|uniref:Sulfite efflux pump SSU1 n=1 Tax=Exophiala aquamarina CBS 119918 TaxID=1182545 RepID=A0A072P397_9EURO|nr:uncharacterized protein A1O9_09972 [Exophiala aquamarina CBS 119918]KEF54177.1 hypothetical protein A1O9_09972 [Exophiala aquamarina CBS 119918]